MATYERVDYGSADGCQIGGASTDKVAFHGSTPVVQASNIATVTASTTITAAVSAINSILTVLKDKGLLASS
jgi:hypothetical protein